MPVLFRKLGLLGGALENPRSYNQSVKSVALP